MLLDKKSKCVNFLAKRLTHLNIYDTKINVLLDLFEAGYKNAYVSVMDFYSQQNNLYTRIEMVLPNVGRLCLYQTFCEVLDTQMPHITVFYSSADKPNISNRIDNADLLKRSMNIIYSARKYFAEHPEYTLISGDLVKRIANNQKIAKKQYEKIVKQRCGWLQPLRQK